MTTLTL